MKKHTPTISIVTCCWNKSHLIKGYIHTLNRVIGRLSATEIELILVDDCSTDDTPDYLDQWQQSPEGPEVKRVLHLPTNMGFAAANNAAAPFAHGRFVLYVNNDVIWAEDPLPAFIREYRGGRKQPLMGAHYLSHDTGHNVLKGKPVPYLEGWCLFMSAHVHSELRVSNLGGIFDEVNFPVAYFEDVDLSLRAKLQGIELRHRPGVPVRHLGSRTTQGTPGFQYNERARLNREAFLKKWRHLKGDEW